MADTIAAIATAPGLGAVAIIRLSGSDSASIAERVFNSKKRLGDHPREMIYGSIFHHDGSLLDDGLAVYMQSPNSYTGEDTVEFFCHGSPVVQKELLASLIVAGARQAKPGEFTQRAFLNGKMDLSQAEAVIDLIDSETLEAAKNAAAQMSGRMGEDICKIRDSILDIISSFCAYVDYPDEEIDEPTRAQTISDLNSANDLISKLIASFDQGQIIKSGISTALIGRPNAGKSSVLNALLGYERSIVSDIAGTTRDTIEEKARIGNIVLRLIDTAGLRSTTDTIEKIGVERAEKAAHDASLILAVFDGSMPLDVQDEDVLNLCKGRCAIAIINKNDLELKIDLARIRAVFGEQICIVSAQENDGFDALRDMLSSLFDISALRTDGTAITNIRHLEALKKAHEHILNAQSALESGFTPDISISDLELAVDALGEITGQTASEQVIGRIFERFCVGK